MRLPQTQARDVARGGRGFGHRLGAFVDGGRPLARYASRARGRLPLRSRARHAAARAFRRYERSAARLSCARPRRCRALHHRHRSRERLTRSSAIFASAARRFAMSTAAPAWVSDLLKSMRGVRIAVAGDIMLDEWLWGSVRRISPEAPVPVVEVDSQSFTLGGAGNVANNLAALGAKVRLIGVVGDDDAGVRALALCEKLGIEASGIAVTQARP